ncbi:hypothetical protein NDU88_005472 [Pleurodeles waltl]|uniref:Uncharacterized protein n=1 Tax=Pleurodeles waltl TaxID=8319 RepID=A0AAV7L4Y2_PLEWA|nr:hypothetical protein NDU88_005472 [Pleurodeles waltl]
MQNWPAPNANLSHPLVELSRISAKLLSTSVNVSDPVAESSRISGHCPAPDRQLSISSGQYIIRPWESTQLRLETIHQEEAHNKCGNSPFLNNIGSANHLSSLQLARRPGVSYADQSLIKPYSRSLASLQCLAQIKVRANMAQGAARVQVVGRHWLMEWAAARMRRGFCFRAVSGRQGARRSEARTVNGKRGNSIAFY